MGKLLLGGSTKLFSASQSNSEYKKMIRTLTGDNKSSDLEATKINDALLEQACQELSAAKKIDVIHDPSDIRKPHSKKAENLGKVRDLKGNIINGYSRHNAVALVPNDKKVHLLSHVSYSNKDPKFLKAEFVKKIEAGKSFEGDKEAKKLHESGDYFNKKIVSIKEIKKVGKALESENPDAVITHILDREFDDNDYLTTIGTELNQNFITRSKKSRTIEATDNDGKKIKLNKANYDHEGEKVFQKLIIGKQCLQDGKIIISFGEFEGYNAVKIMVSDREGNRIFKDDMVLLTNKKVSTLEDAYEIYMGYLSRSKIEYVFKFLKQGLGWEEMQIKNFKGIQNLLAVCFYVASYLYEMGKEKAFDDYAILLAKLGDGKGKVTKHFVIKGIRKLLTYHLVDQFFKENNVSQEKQNELSDAVEIVL